MKIQAGTSESLIAILMLYSLDRRKIFSSILMVDETSEVTWNLYGIHVIQEPHIAVILILEILSRNGEIAQKPEATTN